MIWGCDFDSYNKPSFPVETAVKAGLRANYVKMGGNNLSGNKPLMLSGYAGFIRRLRATGARCGHYWLTGGHDPVGAARVVLANIQWQPGDFFVLDNEALNYGNRWTDDECMAFWATLAPAGITYNRFLYGAQLNDFGRLSFPRQWSSGIWALIALYNGNTIALPSAPGVPQSAIKGHQFTSTGRFNGWSGTCDMNVFADDAFIDGNEDMPLTDADVLKIFQGKFDSGQKNPDGSPRIVQFWEAIRDSAYGYGDILYAQTNKILAALAEVGINLTPEQLDIVTSKLNVDPQAIADASAKATVSLIGKAGA